MLLATGLGWIDWGVLAGYVAVVLGIGVAASRKGEDRAGYFLAGRSMPVWLVAVSVLATTLSAGTFVGAPQDAYAGNLSYLILNIGTVLGALVAAFIILPRVYAAGTLTVYGYLGQRFGGGARTAGSIAFLLGRLLGSGVRLFIAALAFSLVIPEAGGLGTLIPAIVLLGMVGTVYTVSGGLRAIVWTDAMQIMVVVGVAIASVVLLWRQVGLPAGDVTAMLRAAPEGDKLQWLSLSTDPNAPYTLWTALGITLLLAAWYGTDQDLAQRLLATGSPTKATRSVIAGVLIGLPVTALFMAVGLLLWVRHQQDPAAAAGLATSAKVFPHYIVTAMPAGLKGLAMAGLFAAAMSSFDSAAGAMASSVVDDLGLDWPNRLVVAAIGVGVTGVAILAAAAYDPAADTLLQFALRVMTFAYGGLLGVYLVGVLTRRGNTVTAVAGLLAGSGTVLTFWVLHKTATLSLAFVWPMVIGTAVSFTVCVAGPRKSPPL